MTFRKVTHVIFDMDGLLIDSESAYGTALAEIAKQFGKENNDNLKSKLLGLTDVDTARVAVKELDLPITYDEFHTLFSLKSRAAYGQIKLMPGAKDLVKYFHENGIPIAIGTSSSKQSMEIKTQYLQHVFSLFNHVVCGSSDPEVKQGKPAPDIFLVCASRFPDKPDPSKCLVFEDAPNGIQAALRAGMQGILVPAEYINQELRKPATLVLESLANFQPELFGLPLLRKPLRNI